MDESEINWDDLRLFLSVARNGGLAAAEIDSGKSAPTLGRRMLALERRLNRDLFKRQARGYELTQEGKALLDKAIDLENSIDPIFAQNAQAMARRVKISAGTWTTLQLSKHIHTLQADDSVLLQFLAADHVLDIAHREVVIGIRNQRPTQIHLAGQRIQRVKFAVYAKNSSISQWVAVLGTTPSAHWVNQQLNGAPLIEVSQARISLDMALQGRVKTVLPTFIGDDIPDLERVSDEIQTLEHEQWLVTHHDDRHQREVREIITRIQSVLQPSS